MPGWEDLRKEVFSKAPPCRLPSQVKLPVVPQAVIRFAHLAEHPDANIIKLAETLETDSTLTAELLRHVNSAIMGLKKRISSVRQAIAAVGIRRSRTLVLTAALKTALHATTSPLISAVRFQNDNLERALFAREMARQLRWESELAYTGGMLLDLLLPSLTATNVSGYAQFPKSRKRLDQFEIDRFGWSHGMAAARLMHEWGFPSELILGVYFHHDIDRILEDPLMRNSSVMAMAAAAALPDSLDQAPHGLPTLMRLQDEFPKFQFLSVAAAVDAAMAEMMPNDGTRVPLCDRLGAMAVGHLEGQRLDTIVTQKHLGNYTLEEELGRGGMGMVFRARHDRLKRPAALKLLKLSTISPRSIEQFETEVQITSLLTSPNTIGIYDYGVTPTGVFYYVMEYIDGINLTRLIREHGPQREGRVIHLLLQACGAIGEAHAAGLIHRDIKPDNLMVANRGGVPDFLKVLDFGLAQLIEDPVSKDRSHGLSGTPLFMSPDAFLHPQSIDGRSDIYSLGAVMYFLLTGEPVFSGNEVMGILRQHVESRPLPPSVRSGRVIATDLEEIVLQCLEKRPDDRPATIVELANRLRACRNAGDWTHALATEWWANQASVAASAEAAMEGSTRGGGGDIGAQTLVVSSEALEGMSETILQS